MPETALLAILLAGIGGVLAGRAWAAARRRGDLRDRPGFRMSPHYTQGLHYLASGQLERAIHVHQSLLARSDLSRAERAHALSSLGTDFRRAGFLDRAARTYAEALE